MWHKFIYYICIISVNTYLWFHIKITFLLNLIIFWFTNSTICNDINFVLVHSPVLCLRKVSYIFVEFEDRQFLGEIKLQATNLLLPFNTSKMTDEGLRTISEGATHIWRERGRISAYETQRVLHVDALRLNVRFACLFTSEDAGHSSYSVLYSM